MNIIYICAAFDLLDPITSITDRFIEIFERNADIDKIHVLTLNLGKYRKRDNVDVHDLSSNGRGKINRLALFYRTIYDLIDKENIKYIYIYQGGPYPLLLLPFKIIKNIPIFMWKAHPRIGLLMNINARFCLDLIFTTAFKSFPLNLEKVKIVGQGININKFKRKKLNKNNRFCTIGRITPSKNILQMIDVIYELHNVNQLANLDIYGPIECKEYKDEIKKYIKLKNLESYISLKGPLIRDSIPSVLGEYTYFLNFSETALDRAALEAMSVGNIIFSTNSLVGDELAQINLKNKLFFSNYNSTFIASKINEIVSHSTLDEKIEISLSLSLFVKNNHSDIKQYNKIFAHIHNYISKS